jgi:MFS family permease
MTKIPRSVRLLGLVSLLNDMASEMLYPVIPIFITQVLGAPVAILGLIDGVAEGVAAVSKSIFGRWSDALGRRKAFLAWGYAGSTLGKVVIALARSWEVLFVGRIADRLGKGVRTGARDALLLAASEDATRGRNFGFQQSLDSAGAVIGPLATLALLPVVHGDIRTVIVLALIPSVLAVLTVALVRDVRHRPSSRSALSSTKVRTRHMPRELRAFLFASGLFALGNSSDSFLILRARNVGLSLSLVILAYVLYNFVYSTMSLPAGVLADRFGARRVFIVGVIVYALVYLGFAVNSSKVGVWILFGIYGLYIAFTDSVSRALVGGFIAAPDEAAGIFGLLQTVISTGLVLASIIGGVLWSAVSPRATFLFGAACAVAALIVFVGGVLSPGGAQSREGRSWPIR